MTVATERNVGLSDRAADVSLFEETMTKARWKFIWSSLVVLWVLLVTAAYFSQYAQPLCTLLKVPVLCTP